MKIKKISIPELNADLSKIVGMLLCDGSMPIKHNGEGGRNYLLYFCGTEKDIVTLFSNKIFELFELKGTISNRTRGEKRLPIYEYYLYSKEICEFFNKEFNVPYGKKSRIIEIPNKIKDADNTIKSAFLNGCIITDGGIKKRGTLIFHMASKNFVIQLSGLIYQLYNIESKTKEYKQGDFLSYQINFKKGDSYNILSGAGLAER